jgi:hypothetical protein
MLYNSDSVVVLQVDVPTRDAWGDAPRAGYEIVDKFARKGIFIEGAIAQSFKTGVQALIDAGPSEEALDDFIGGYTTLAQQPVIVH